MPIPVGDSLLSDTDLARHLHVSGFSAEDEPAAEAAVEFAVAQVHAALGFDVLDTTLAVEAQDITVAKGVALRVAAQWYTNPQDRASYSAPEGLSWTPSPQMLSKIMSPADRADLAGIACRYAPGFA